MEIPEGWKNEIVDNVCEQVSVGIVIRPSELYAEKGDIVRVFRSANVREGFIQNSDWKFIRRDAHDANSKSKLRTDDVLIVRTGYPGTACVVTPEYDDTNCVDIVFARPGKRLRSDYLCAYTNSSEGRRQTLAKQGGLAQKHLNVGAYKKMRIPLPPIAEQIRIAEILGTWDRAIAATEALIAKSEAQKKALMQQLLTAKRRLPGFDGDWQEVRLGDVAELTSGNAFKSPDILEEGQYRLIRMNDLKAGVLKHDEPRFIADQAADGLKRFILHPGDFVFGMTGSLSNYAWIPHGLSNTLYLNQRVGRLSAKKNNSNRFLQHLYLSTPVQNNIVRMAAGAAQLNISLRDLRSFVISVPSLEEQKEIAEIIDASADETQALQAKLQTLKTEKAALMQQLLTGKRRVKLTEVAA